MNISLDRGLRHLAAAGLNLVAVLAVEQWPAAVVAALEAANVPWTNTDRVVLVGHGGRQLWRAFQAAGGPDGEADPLDRFTRRQISQVLEKMWDIPPTHYRYLYPLSPVTIPLQQLGTAAGWAHRSPIGSDIHPDYGLWFAYRAAVLTSADLPLLSRAPAPSPCETCVDQPCIAACPAGAVGQPGQFQLTPCLAHRIRPGSSCAAQCLARLACPVAPQHRYAAAQIAYHYDLSRSNLRAYLD